MEGLWCVIRIECQSCSINLTALVERDAFGCDEYHPVSRTGKNLTTERGIGYMIVDALDTMLIMGQPLQEEYRRARNWVATELDFDRDGRYSTFEVIVSDNLPYLYAYQIPDHDTDPRGFA